MSPELDTYAITKKVKEVLTDNNLGETSRKSIIITGLQATPKCLLFAPKICDSTSQFFTFSHMCEKSIWKRIY